MLLNILKIFNIFNCLIKSEEKDSLTKKVIKSDNKNEIKLTNEKSLKKINPTTSSISRNHKLKEKLHLNNSDRVILSKKIFRKIKDKNYKGTIYDKCISGNFYNENHEKTGKFKIERKEFRGNDKKYDDDNKNHR